MGQLETLGTVAIKRLHANSLANSKAFEAGAALLASLSHVRVVRLLSYGYCGEHGCLVYRHFAVWHSFGGSAIQMAFGTCARCGQISGLLPDYVACHEQAIANVSRMLLVVHISLLHNMAICQTNLMF